MKTWLSKLYCWEISGFLVKLWLKLCRTLKRRKRTNHFIKLCVTPYPWDVHNHYLDKRKGEGGRGPGGKRGIELRYFTERERELQLQIPSLTTSSRTRRSSPNPTSISTHPSPSLQQLVSGTWPLLGSHVMEQSNIERAEMLWSFQIYLKSFDVLFSGNIENIPLVLVLMWSWCIEVTRAD